MTTAPAELVARLRAAGCVFAEDEARVLTESARDDPQLREFTARRVAGEPLEHVVGWAEFRGLRVVVEPGVFVPRRRTEFLVEQAVRIIDAGTTRAVVVDLCCGSGALALAVRAVADTDVHACDIDPRAVRCARRNLGDKVYAGDLFDALPGGLRGRVDVLVVNAPYVPTAAIAGMPAEAREHEARIALDGGADGLDVHRRVFAGARDWLAPGGSVLIETSEAQATRGVALAERSGLIASIVRDEDVDSTVLVATPATRASANQ